mgnify:CR=1 FL=1
MANRAKLLYTMFTRTVCCLMLQSFCVLHKFILRSTHFVSWDESFIPAWIPQKNRAKYMILENLHKYDNYFYYRLLKLEFCSVWCVRCPVRIASLCCMLTVIITKLSLSTKTPASLVCTFCLIFEWIGKFTSLTFHKCWFFRSMRNRFQTVVLPYHLTFLMSTKWPDFDFSIYIIKGTQVIRVVAFGISCARGTWINRVIQNDVDEKIIEQCKAVCCWENNGCQRALQPQDNSPNYLLLTNPVFASWRHWFRQSNYAKHFFYKFVSYYMYIM